MNKIHDKIITTWKKVKKKNPPHFQNFARLIFIISSYISTPYNADKKDILRKSSLNSYRNIFPKRRPIEPRPLIQRYVTKQLYRAYVIVAYN